MNGVVAGLFRGMRHVLLSAMGLVFVASVLCAAMVLALVWALCVVWQRLTGRPVTPWRVHIRHRGFGGFRSTMRAFRDAHTPSGMCGAAQGKTPPDDAAATRRSGILPGADEVTDVRPRDKR